MKHYKRINQALAYIEANLSNDIILTDISTNAFSSLSYMHRIFFQMTGFTLKEYIRQRRLAMAVSLLQSTQQSVLDIALITQYQSAESFARAFKKHFGISPSTCRKQWHELPICQPVDLNDEHHFTTPNELDFTLTLEAVSLPAFSIIGAMINTTLQNNQQAVDICAFHHAMIQSRQFDTHFDLNKTPIYGVYTDMTDQNEFNYTLGGLADAYRTSNERWVTHHIEAATYAKFTLNRHDRIKEAWHYIYGHWFPQIETLRSHGYDFEIYNKASTSIYIPMDKVPIEASRKSKE